MKGTRNFVLLLTLGVGLLGTAASAQNSQFGRVQGAPAEYANGDGVRGATVQLADWDDHRRCDGDHDRDDRGCYDRDYNRGYYGYNNGYYNNGYYSNGYATPYYYNAQPAGWYDRYGYWHAYDRDRDRDRRRHDDDDRR
jgi:hypothetical protein